MTTSSSVTPFKLDLAAVVAHELVQSSPSVTYEGCGTEVNPPIVRLPIVSQQSLPFKLSSDAVINEIHAPQTWCQRFCHWRAQRHWQIGHFQEIVRPAALRGPEVIRGSG